METEINPAAAASTRSYRETPVLRTEHAENTLTRLVEHQAAKLPSDYFLIAALGSMVVALGLELKGQDRAGRFVGMWVAPLLIMGVYNKLVKVFGPR